MLLLLLHNIVFNLILIVSSCHSYIYKNFSITPPLLFFYLFLIFSFLFKYWIKIFLSYNSFDCAMFFMYASIKNIANWNYIINNLEYKSILHFCQHFYRNFSKLFIAKFDKFRLLWIFIFIINHKFVHYFSQNFHKYIVL